MTARFYFRNSEGDVTEIVDRISREGWALAEQAEQGTAGMSSLVIDDPGMDFDIDGHRYLVVVEDESEDTDNVLFGGYTHEQEIARSGGEWLEPLGRIWTVGVSDMNAIWQRRVMVGADCDRPAETDVARMQWLLASAEAGPIDNITDFVSTADPISMDAADYRGQMFAQVVDDCAQASGKNYYLWEREIGTGRETVAWYGRDTLAVYDSPLFLSNDPADWDDDELEAGTSVVWQISMDTTLRRDPSRVYSGAYVTYDPGAVYRQDAATEAQFASRDFIAPSLNVKSKAKAEARALRYLDELDEQDLIVHTTVELPAGKATMLRAGMRVRFRASHLPGFNTAATWTWCRVLTSSITPVAAGERYQLTMDLAPVGQVMTEFTGSAFAAVLHSYGYTGDEYLGFGYSGDLAPGGWYGTPTVGPLAVIETEQPFLSIVSSAAMTVRIEVDAYFAGVWAGPRSVTIDVLVDAVIVGSATLTHEDGTYFWADDVRLDVRDVPLLAGSVVTFNVTPATGGGWRNVAPNSTYLRVGRGTQVWDAGNVTWVGP